MAAAATDCDPVGAGVRDDNSAWVAERLACTGHRGPAEGGAVRMTPATPEHLGLARRLLAHAGARLSQEPEHADAGEPAAAGLAMRVCLDLRETLLRVIGPTGFTALVGRALTLARDEYPEFHAVRVAADGSLIGLDVALAESPPGAALTAAATLIGAVIGLLVTFIGEDLTRRLIRRTWPDLPDAAELPGADWEETDA